MKTVKLDIADSTNRWTSDRSSSLEWPCLVYAVEQTAGRGQRGNSWESQPGMNLTCSALFRPEGVETAAQFVISEAVALAVADLLEGYGVKALVKWPNDIYVGDRKICGILIENSIMGREIMRSVAGIGVNINQSRFVSDAPNPVSLVQLTGEEHPVDKVAADFADILERRLAMLESPKTLHEEFLRRMWRADGSLYPFLDKTRNQQINARISAVDPDGILTLTTDSGEQRKFAFKEVEFILSH